MASNAVCAMETRSPAAVSCSARAARVRALLSAMRTCAIRVAGPMGADANTLEDDSTVEDLRRSTRCTAPSASKKSAVEYR